MVPVPLPETAIRLGVSWSQAWRLLLTGVLVGTKVSGRWMVDETSVVAYERGRSQKAPRTTAPPT